MVSRTAKDAAERTAFPVRIEGGRGRRREWLTAYGFVMPYALFFLIFTIGPTVLGFSMGFFRWELLLGTREFIGVRNFTRLFQDDLFWTSSRVSLQFAVLTVIGNVAVSMAAAIALRGLARGQSFFRSVLYAPTILSIAVMGIIMGRVLSTNGLLNYLLALLGIRPIRWLGDAKLVIPTLAGVTVWWGFGFPMLIFLSALYAIPVRLYEAAELDGAGPWASFFYVTIPLLRPALLFVCVTQFISHMQVFGQAYILTQGGPGYASYPLILYLYQTAWRYYRMGYASTMAICLAIFMLGVSFLQFRIMGQRVEF